MDLNPYCQIQQNLKKQLALTYIVTHIKPCITSWQSKWKMTLPLHSITVQVVIVILAATLAIFCSNWNSAKFNI